MNIDLLLEMHRRMMRIRRFDEACIPMAAKGEIVGPCHTSIGQEGSVVGACMAVNRDDYMTGTHRSHGHPIGKGASLSPLMAEILGRRTGVCKGKGGSMHLADFSVGSLGESGILASGMPVAAGAGLSAKVRKSGQVCLSFFGEGASNEGACHEALNLSAAWRLPVIWLCEYNGYAVSVDSSTMMAITDITSRAAGYGMPGFIVDGQDVVAVYEAVHEAAGRARAGKGPTLVEAKTYRFRMHCEGLNLPRPQDEIDRWVERDPITIHAARLLDQGVSQDQIDTLEQEVQAEIDEALEFARESPWPDPEEAYEDLYAQPIPLTR